MRSLRRIFAILFKEFMQLRRDRMTFGMVIMIPLIIWTFSFAPVGSATVFAVYAMVVALSDNVLKPLLLGRGVDLPVLIVLLGLHVAGAIKHEVAAEQGVFKRMIPGLFGRPHTPGPANGYVIAFGGAALLFAAIAAVPMMQSASSAPAGLGVTGVVTAEAGNWDIDKEVSEIAFYGTYEGKSFSGTFARWDATVLFDPDDLEGSAVTVEVQPGSARTGTKLYDDTLQSGEWFDTNTYPLVKVSLINFAASPDGSYTAEASMLVKEKAVRVPFNFSLIIEGDTASFEGTATLSRAAMNLGQQSDPGADWVADDVTVTVKGTATRKE